jgi:hypothetical protein
MVTLTLPAAGRKRWLFLAACTAVVLGLLAYAAGYLSGEATTLLICIQ